MLGTRHLAGGRPSGLPWVVPQTIDVERQVLTRVVSDVMGLIEREEISLDHACVTCAVREDIIPTLERLAKTGRWTSIVACLPMAAEATQVCRILAMGAQQGAAREHRRCSRCA